MNRGIAPISRRSHIKEVGIVYMRFPRRREEVITNVFIQPVLSNVGECRGLGGWGGGGRGALHMLCKVSLLPLLVSTFACNFFKLKRASRSHAKTGFFDGSKSMAGAVF